MSMQDYETRRSDLWRLAYKNDPAFPYDDTPIAKVISFFCKRGNNDPEVNITKNTPEKVWDYDIMVDTSWFKTNLNRVLKSKKTWYGDQDLYNFIVLQNYLDQLVAGKYKQCILSKREWATLAPKKKKNTIKPSYR